MTLADMVVDAHTVIALLERIAVALERLAPPSLPDLGPVRQAQLSDLRYVSPADVDSIRAAELEFGLQHGVVPRSPAYFAAIHAFEESVAKELGQEAVDSLPWKAHEGQPT